MRNDGIIGFVNVSIIALCYSLFSIYLKNRYNFDYFIRQYIEGFVIFYIILIITTVFMITWKILNTE